MALPLVPSPVAQEKQSYKNKTNNLMTWHTQNSEPTISSLVPGVVSLPIFCLDTYLSELAKSSNTLATSYSPDSETASSQSSQSGTTSAHSTASLGADLLTSSAVDFPAKTLAPQGKARVLAESEAVYGVRWHASFAKCDPDTHLWKTPQCSLLGDLEPFSETWPRWGMMQNGVCSERVTPEHLTSEIESGYSLPTPTKMDATLGTLGKAGAKGKHSVQLSHLANSGALIYENPHEVQDLLRSQGLLSKAERKEINLPLSRPESMKPRQVPTRKGDQMRWETSEEYWSRQDPPAKNNPAQNFPTPYGLSANQGQGGGEFEKAIRHWPTPTVAEATKIPATANYGQIGLNNHPLIRGLPTRPKGEKSRDGGTSTPQKVPTPQARDWKGRSGRSIKGTETDVPNYAFQKEGKGQLNPSWVEWLMGWPISWTAMKHLSLEEFRAWLRASRIE